MRKWRKFKKVSWVSIEEFSQAVTKEKNIIRISREDAIELLLLNSNYNATLNKVKRKFTPKESKQLYLLVKLLLAQ